jgi:hypothetical protein
MSTGLQLAGAAADQTLCFKMASANVGLGPPGMAQPAAPQTAGGWVPFPEAAVYATLVGDGTRIKKHVVCTLPHK